MVDWPTVELVVASRDTSYTDPSGFPLTDGYDIDGTAAHGSYAFYLRRAGFADDEPFESGSFEGGFDEEGKNATMLYVANVDTVDPVVDGGNVTGTVEMQAITPDRPCGDTVVVAFAFSC